MKSTLSLSVILFLIRLCQCSIGNDTLYNGNCDSIKAMTSAPVCQSALIDTLAVYSSRRIQHVATLSCCARFGLNHCLAVAFKTGNCTGNEESMMGAVSSIRAIAGSVFSRVREDQCPPHEVLGAKRGLCKGLFGYFNAAIRKIKVQEDYPASEKLTTLEAEELLGQLPRKSIFSLLEEYEPIELIKEMLKWKDHKLGVDDNGLLIFDGEEPDFLYERGARALNNETFEELWVKAWKTYNDFVSDSTKMFLASFNQTTAEFKPNPDFNEFWANSTRNIIASFDKANKAFFANSSVLIIPIESTFDDSANKEFWANATRDYLKSIEASEVSFNKSLEVSKEFWANATRDFLALFNTSNTNSFKDFWDNSTRTFLKGFKSFNDSDDFNATKDFEKSVEDSKQFWANVTRDFLASLDNSKFNQTLEENKEFWDNVTKDFLASLDKSNFNRTLEDNKKLWANVTEEFNTSLNESLEESKKFWANATRDFEAAFNKSLESSKSFFANLSSQNVNSHSNESVKSILANLAGKILNSKLNETIFRKNNTSFNSRVNASRNLEDLLYQPRSFEHGTRNLDEIMNLINNQGGLFEAFVQAVLKKYDDVPEDADFRNYVAELEPYEIVELLQEALVSNTDTDSTVPWNSIMDKDGILVAEFVETLLAENNEYDRKGRCFANLNFKHRNQTWKDFFNHLNNNHTGENVTIHTILHKINASLTNLTRTGGRSIDLKPNLTRCAEMEAELGNFSTDSEDLKFNGTMETVYDSPTKWHVWLDVNNISETGRVMELLSDTGDFILRVDEIIPDDTGDRNARCTINSTLFNEGWKEFKKRFDDSMNSFAKVFTKKDTVVEKVEKEGKSPRGLVEPQDAAEDLNQNECDKIESKIKYFLRSLELLDNSSLVNHELFGQEGLDMDHVRSFHHSFSLKPNNHVKHFEVHHRVVWNSTVVEDISAMGELEQLFSNTSVNLIVLNATIHTEDKFPFIELVAANDFENLTNMDIEFSVINRTNETIASDLEFSILNDTQFSVIDLANETMASKIHFSFLNDTSFSIINTSNETMEIELELSHLNDTSFSVINNTNGSMVMELQFSHLNDTSFSVINTTNETMESELLFSLLNDTSFSVMNPNNETFPSYIEFLVLNDTILNRAYVNYSHVKKPIWSTFFSNNTMEARNDTPFFPELFATNQADRILIIYPELYENYTDQFSSTNHTSSDDKKGRSLHLWDSVFVDVKLNATPSTENTDQSFNPENGELLNTIGFNEEPILNFTNYLDTTFSSHHTKPHHGHHNRIVEDNISNETNETTSYRSAVMFKTHSQPFDFGDTFPVYVETTTNQIDSTTIVPPSTNEGRDARQFDNSFQVFSPNAQKPRPSAKNRTSRPPVSTTRKPSATPKAENETGIWTHNSFNPKESDLLNAIRIMNSSSLPRVTNLVIIISLFSLILNYVYNNSS